VFVKRSVTIIEAMALMRLLSLCTLLMPMQAAKLAQSSLNAIEMAADLSADRLLAPTGLLDSLEADVAHLWKALHGSRSTASLVQLASDLKSVNASQPAKAVAKVSAKVALRKKKGIDATTAVKEMNNLKGGLQATGPAMLGLLTGMYDSWKEKIGEANKREHEQKAEFDKTIKGLEAKKAMYKSNDTDAIATYDRIEKYWKRQRSISHRQYHTALKIMHGGMQKFKAVSGAMEHAIAGKKPNAKDLQTVGLAMPDVMLLQQWTETARKSLRDARWTS